MAQCFAAHSLPMALADSEDFRRLLYSFRQSNEAPPSRKELPKQFYERVKSIKPRVINALRQATGVTVGIDGWTNVRHQKVVNLVGVANGVAYYWDSLVLEKRSTAKAQTKPVGDGIKSIIDQGVVVVGLVTDNERVNYKLYEHLSEKRFTFLIHVPCAAHTIQLCVKSVIALPSIIKICNGLDALIHAFSDNKQLRIALSSMQKNLRKGVKELSLIRHNATRWSSRLRSSERVIRLKECLLPLVPQIVAHLAKNKDVTLHTHRFETSWWESLEILTVFLKPFQVATDVVQSDNSTLLDVYNHIITLVKHIEALVAPHAFAAIVPQMREIIRLHWDKHVNVNAVIMCATFSFDNNYTMLFTPEVLNEAIAWFPRWGARFVKEYGLSDETNESKIATILMDQLSKMKTGTSVFTNLSEWKRMLETAAGQQRWDSRRLWALYKDSAPEIASCALALLSLTASEAAVERTFSKQGLLHTNIRNKMSDELIQAQMFIAFNQRALERKGKPDDDGGEVELNDNYQNIAYTTDLFLSPLSDDAIRAAPEMSVNPPDLTAPMMDVDESGEDADESEEDVEEKEDEKVLAEEEEQIEHEDPIQLFIKEYVRAHNITHRFRWGADALNALQSAIIEKNLTITQDYMKNKIKVFVAPVDMVVSNEILEV